MQQMSTMFATILLISAVAVGPEQSSVVPAPAPFQSLDWPERPLGTIVAIGESTTNGEVTSKEELRWTDQLQELLNRFQDAPARVVNEGIGYNAISPDSKTQFDGDFNGDSALERIDNDVLALEPDLIIIQYGLNDMGGLNPVHWFVGEYQKLIDHIRSKSKAKILLVDVAHLTAYGKDRYNVGDDSFTHQYNLGIEELAARNGIPLVRMHRAFNHQDGWIHPDKVHPADLGHTVMAHEIFKVIAGGK